MRKRYGWGYRVHGMRWKWTIRDEAVLKEFEQDWKGGRGFILKRRATARRVNPTWEEVHARLLADDPEARMVHERDEGVVEIVRDEMRSRGLDPRWGRLIAYRIVEHLEDTDWL